VTANVPTSRDKLNYRPFIFTLGVVVSRSLNRLCAALTCFNFVNESVFCIKMRKRHDLSLRKKLNVLKMYKLPA